MRTTARAHLLLSVSSCLSLGFSAGTAFSQNAGADADREAQRILREQQEQQRQQIEQQRRKLPAPKGNLEIPAAGTPSAGGGPCRDIKDIVIGSAPNLPAADRKRIVDAYSGRCLRVHDIEQLMAEVTNAYITRGYVTTRVYLPQQDLSKGQLSVLVVEGVVEQISANGKGADRVSLAGALPGVRGQPLNLRDLEQGLDQINRLQSNHATLDIEPGAVAGASRIVIHNQAARAFHLGATLDDTGEESTGKHQAGLTTALDSPLGVNDFLSLTYRQGLPVSQGDHYSRLGSVVYSIPYGYTTASLAYSRSDYASTFSTASGTVVATEGDSAVGSLKLEQVLHRGRSSRLTLSGSLTTKSTNNFLAGQYLDVSSRNLTTGDVALNLTTGFLGGVFSVEGGYSRGFDALGAMNDASDLPASAPRAQFGRYNYNASYALPFRAAGLDASFTSSFGGQRAKTALYGSEQILVGGIYSVRGFDHNSLSGDNGFVWRNELSVRFPLSPGASLQSFVRPYLGIDYGRTSMRERETGTPEGALSGATLGLAVSSGSFGFEVFNSRPMHVPSYMTREGSQTYFRFSMSL
jgi:hemolysin activation/secretion protein